MIQTSDPQSPQSQPSPPLALPAPPRKRRTWLYVLIAVVVMAALLLFGWLPRAKTTKAVDTQASDEKNALPVVEVMMVQQGNTAEQLTLPGTVTPQEVVHIYSRAAGFLKARYVDLGDTVHKGQLLAAVSAPDLDAAVLQQQSLLRESREALHTAESQQALQQVTYDRIHLLVLHGVLSQQDDDVARAALTAAQNSVRSAESAVVAAAASLSGATASASFEQIRSPINGTVTARNVETGTLVSAAGAGQGLTSASPTAPAGGPPTGGAQGNELFDIANLRDLLVFVTVPEDDAPFVQTGQPAVLTFSEMPSQPFTGVISRTSDSLSQQTRTLLIEIKVSDAQHRLRPGMFASVQLHFNATNPGILISGDSVLPTARGQFVAVVENCVVQMRPVHVGRDLGTQVYVTTGLRNGEQVVVNPTDAVKQGAHVNTQAAPKGQQQ